MTVPAFYSLVLEDAAAAARVWLPFLDPGGLLVAARREHALGEEVVLLAQLPNGARHSVAGRIAWLGADNLLGPRRTGAGIALTGEEGRALAGQIHQLAGAGEGISAADALLAAC